MQNICIEAATIHFTCMEALLSLNVSHIHEYLEKTKYDLLFLKLIIDKKKYIDFLMISKIKIYHNLFVN